MQSLPNIQQLIDENRLDEASKKLNEYIEANPNDDDAWFMRGRLHWRRMDYGAAVTDFETAVSLNSESGAQHALELARDVFNFYHKDLYNP